MKITSFKNTIARLFGRHATSSQGEELRVEQTLQELFDKLNIKWEATHVTQEGKETPEKDYHFQFQNGDFHVMGREGRSFVRIHFLFFLETPFGAIDNVRYACNEFNQQYGDFKVIYSVNEREHSIALHVMASFRLSPMSRQLLRDFGSTLTMCFEAARSFRDIFDAIQSNDSGNLEEHNAMNARERHLAHEAELINQNGGHEWRSNEVEHHYLEQLFYTLCGTPLVGFHRLRIVADELQELSDPDAIALYDVTAALIRHDNDGALFIRESATLLVEATIGGEQRQEYLLHLHAEDEAQEVLYMRLTFVPPIQNFSPTHSRMATEIAPSPVRSLLIAYDTSTTSQRKAEFEYLWKEMNDLIDKGETLSTEQQFVAFCTWPNASYNLYWGRRFFESRRYYDALRHLENAYIALNQHYHSLRKSARDNFYRLAYYIGFCYAELGLYRQAYYYLDIAFPQNDYQYTTEYVNALTNSGDFRALSIINSLLQSISSNLSNEEEENSEDIEHARRFLQFLKRRKSFILINLRQLDEAELLLKDLLGDPENEDFALQKLLYIQELREQQSSTSPATDAPL